MDAILESLGVMLPGVTPQSGDPDIAEILGKSLHFEGCQTLGCGFRGFGRQDDSGGLEVVC